MRRDLITKINSSFLSFEKDCELILKKLFIESQPYSDYLKRLLVINTSDCLDINNADYNQIIQKTKVHDLREKGYILLEPKIKLKEHEEVKSYLIFTFDDFTTNNTNPEFRDCTVYIDVICHIDYWDLGNYQMRPLKICGYIDGLLNNTHLTGIGKFQFLGCNEIVLNEHFAGFCLQYRAIHGSDDRIPAQDE